MKEFKLTITKANKSEQSTASHFFNSIEDLYKYLNSDAFRGRYHIYYNMYDYIYKEQKALRDTLDTLYIDSLTDLDLLKQRIDDIYNTANITWSTELLIVDIVNSRIYSCSRNQIVLSDETIYIEELI